MPHVVEKDILLMVAGLKGAIGSTVAVAVQTMNREPDAVLPYLATSGKLPVIGDGRRIHLVGWDSSPAGFREAIERQGVLDEKLWAPHLADLEQIPVRQPADIRSPLRDQVDVLVSDFRAFLADCPGHLPVFVNLLPAGAGRDLQRYSTLEELYAHSIEVHIPDLAYAIAAVEAGVPVVNFTPNQVEIPALLHAAEQRGVPLAGRDGKTGQTYLKVVLASALRARKLRVNGWYSLNILGNADGENLMDPENAACKLSNKTSVLENVLGYQPGRERYGTPSHKVLIDYYPPRGDAKEAWDVIDFEGIFGLDMSLRLNLQGRDSILAAPLVLDLARWMAVLGVTERSGPVPELAFFFKTGIEQSTPERFEDQLRSLDVLQRYLDGQLQHPA